MSPERDSMGKKDPMPFALRIGAILSFVWLVILAKYLNWSWERLAASEPNQVGDFLAGCFAPLAFLWLTVAVFLQKEELSAQRRELEQNRQALLLQADELRCSVEQLSKQTLIFSESHRAEKLAETEKTIESELNQLAEFCRNRLQNVAINSQQPASRESSRTTLFQNRELQDEIEPNDTLLLLEKRLSQFSRHLDMVYPSGTKVWRTDCMPALEDAHIRVRKISKLVRDAPETAAASRARLVKLDDIEAAMEAVHIKLRRIALNA